MHACSTWTGFSNATGKRAIITLEKDREAQILFDEVFASWAKRAAERAASNAAHEAEKTNTGYAFAQFASMATKEDAEVQRAAISVRYALQLGRHRLEVQKSDLGAKGVRYRVYVKTADLSEAAVICQNVIAAGGECFTGNDAGEIDLGL